MSEKPVYSWQKDVDAIRKDLAELREIKDEIKKMQDESIRRLEKLQQYVSWLFESNNNYSYNDVEYEDNATEIDSKKE